MPPLLEARHLRKVFRSGGQRFGPSIETVAVDDFSLSIDADRPSFTTIAGESGSGKTTIARMLLGVLNPSAGEVRYQGRDVHDCKRRSGSKFRKDVQAIFQDPFEVYNPFYKIDHILTTPVRKFGLATSKPKPTTRYARRCARSGYGPRRRWAAIRTSFRAGSASASPLRARCCSSPS